MAVDAYAAHDNGDGTHSHPYLSQATIDLAKRPPVASKRHRDALGNPIVSSYDSRMPCGCLVSACTVGGAYPNAGA